MAAPAALGLAFGHARRKLGARGAALETAVLVTYGYALERAAIAAFASHEYGPGWTLAPGGVPLAVAAAWAAVILSATALARPAGAALVALLLDLMMEPVAVRAGLWTWTPAGPWLGVPVGNFVGWAIIVGVYARVAGRWAGGGSAAAPAARRAVVAALSIACLLAAGLLWRSLGAERAFGGGRGWLVWAAALALAPFVRPRPGGRGTAAVLLVLAAPFVVDAILAGDTAVTVAALGPMSMLALLVARAAGATSGRTS